MTRAHMSPADRVIVVALFAGSGAVLGGAFVGAWATLAALGAMLLAVAAGVAKQGRTK